MFSLWKVWLQAWVLVWYNCGWLYSVSTATYHLKSLVFGLYKFCTTNLPNLVHYVFSIITEVSGGLYPQSTEPITTTTLI
jgi:hypothetical protein